MTRRYISAMISHKHLTPELSRADLRPRQAIILPRPAEAAKRARLEQIVSALSCPGTPACGLICGQAIRLERAGRQYRKPLLRKNFGKSRVCEKFTEAFQGEPSSIQVLNKACDNLRANT